MTFSGIAVREIAFKCDVCDKAKGEANHWFLASVSPTAISIFGWNEGDSARREAIHLCGERCVLRKVSEFIATKLKK